MKYALFLLAVASAAAPPLDAVLARLREKRDATDFRASGRLVRVLPSGERKSYQFSMRAHSFPDALRIFCEITEPAAARLRLLLESRPRGESAIRWAHPGEAAARVLPAAQWGESLLDTAFTYEDLAESHFLWARQALTGEQSYGARRCYVIRSEPGPGDASHYSSVTSWVDKSTLHPVRVLKTLRATGASKEFIYYGLRQVKGIWSASQVECRFTGQSGSSLLIINRGAEKASLDLSGFAPAQLVKP
jgi:hypothetical protein